MKNTLTSIAIAAAALGAVSASQAQIYLGAGLGPSKIDINCAGAGTCDTSDVGFKLYGGWNLPGPFALEAVYFDWGKASRVGGTATALSTEAFGLGIGGAYFINFGWGQCAVRAGIVGNRAKTTTVGSASHNFTSPFVGGGCAYPIAPQWWITGEGDFSRIKYTPSDKANTQLFTLGVRHHF